MLMLLTGEPVIAAAPAKRAGDGDQATIVPWFGLATTFLGKVPIG
jgi:hypothetical protein